jgi:predicted nucleic-acid-binding protein
MRITADTNVLVRSVVGDDPAQAAAAAPALRNAERIAVPLPALCEFVSVLRRLYSFPGADIAASLCALMEAGGDFADGVIAHQGQRLGGETFVSFDRQTASWSRLPVTPSVPPFTPSAA